MIGPIHLARVRFLYMRDLRRYRSYGDDWLIPVCFGLIGREPVAALVVRVAGVAFYPYEGHFVRFEQSEQRLPEVGVERLLFVALYPAARLPRLRPAEIYPVADVFRIGHERDGAGALQRPEPLDAGRELHAVVGRPAFAAGELLLMPVEDEDRSPAARPGIAPACAVGVKGDLSDGGGGHGENVIMDLCFLLDLHKVIQ